MGGSEGARNDGQRNPQIGEHIRCDDVHPPKVLPPQRLYFREDILVRLNYNYLFAHAGI